MFILLSFSVCLLVGSYLSCCVIFSVWINLNLLDTTSGYHHCFIIFSFLCISQPQGFNLTTFNSESQSDLKQKLILYVSFLWNSSC